MPDKQLRDEVVASAFATGLTPVNCCYQCASNGLSTPDVMNVGSHISSYMMSVLIPVRAERGVYESDPWCRRQTRPTCSQAEQGHSAWDMRKVAADLCTDICAHLIMDVCARMSAGDNALAPH
jgi:hypothetical protein